MKIKAKWGFRGDAAKLKNDGPNVRAGQVIDVDDEYAHLLIGKGLVEAVASPKSSEDKESKPAPAKSAAPKSDKQSKAGENK